ncbi:MAG TPA: hypothetical protein VFG98_11150 [Intrasporangium sp.]|nr:hypothetical protein [Intrasporangium sp.]
MAHHAIWPGGRVTALGVPSLPAGVSYLRWVGMCAVAEAVGMAAAATAARSSTLWVGDVANPADVIVALSFIVGAGLVEGFALGVAQASALTAVLPMGRRSGWMLMTVLVAGLGWAGASAPGILAGDTGGKPSTSFLLTGAVGVGAVMGAVLGAAQATVLIGCVPHPETWILANIVGWTVTMPVIFLGASGARAEWDLLAIAMWGGGTGLVAGTVLGIVTGLFLPWLGQPDEPR